jgi:hypothetical protein
LLSRQFGVALGVAREIVVRVVHAEHNHQPVGWWLAVGATRRRRLETLGGKGMKMPPFNSKLPSDRRVHNDNNRCTEGNNIERQNRVQGTGNRPLCNHCARL